MYMYEIKKAFGLMKGSSIESKEGHRRTHGKVNGLTDIYWERKARKGGNNSAGRSNT